MVKVYTNLIDVGDELVGGALAIGNFDGVHLGHQAILNKLCFDFSSKKCGILSFYPHPREILKNDSNLFYLTNFDEKIDIIKKWPLDVFINHKIDKDFLNLSPETFIKNFLKERLKISHIVVGRDFCFGKNRSADVDYLRRIASGFDIDLHIVGDVIVDGIRCSSTYIRELFKKGDIEKASKFLKKG